MTPDETRTVPRGRHRRPRHRRALLAAGALTLTAGAATLVHLATPDAPPRDTRAAPLPAPEESSAPTTPGKLAELPKGTTPPPAPHPVPTSPRAQGGKAQAPLTRPADPSAPPRTTSAPRSARTAAPPPPPPQTSQTAEPPPEHQPTPPPSASPPPAPPPPSDDEDKGRGLCLPLLHLCLGG